MRDDFLDQGGSIQGGGKIARRETSELPANINDSPALQTARLLHDSGLFPGAGGVAGVFTIVQFGREVGLSPVVALNNVNIIKGKIAMSGQSMLALATKHGVKALFKTEIDKECTVVFSREGYEDYTSTFTEADAAEAGLLDLEDGEVKKEAWRKYKKTMLKWRAVAQGLRLIAADILAGIYTQEEINSIEDLTPIESAQNHTSVTEAETDESAQNHTSEEETKTQDSTPKTEEVEQPLGESREPTVESNKVTQSQLKKFHVMATQSGLSHFMHPFKKWLADIEGSGLNKDKPTGKDLDKSFCSNLIGQFEKFSCLFFASPSNREGIKYVFDTIDDKNKVKTLKTISSYINNLDCGLKNINIDSANTDMLVDYLSLFLVGLENQEYNRLSDDGQKKGLSVKEVMETLCGLGFKPEVTEHINLEKNDVKERDKVCTRSSDDFDF